MGRQALKKRKDFTLKIYGQEWKVIYMPEINMGDHKAAGLCDPQSATIYMDENMDDAMTACTFFHELFHAYVRRMGMINANLSPELEEIIADQFGQLLSEIFDFDL